MTVTHSPMKLLDRMYKDATSTADQGTRFERFTQSFLQTDPLWASQFAKVWMWDQWPEKWGHDSGIDLVAERRDGGLTAIQCKFFAPTHRVSKGDLDKFLAASSRSEVKVFPVPQAMINRPRSADSNPAVTSSIAVR